MKWLQNSALALFGVIVALTLGEIGARSLESPKQDRRLHHRCDSATGWRGVAHADFTLRFPDGMRRIRRNSTGMHDRERTVPKQPAAFRVMVLGDSFVEALQVEQPATHVQLLEDRLNARSGRLPRFEVIGAGVSGWGPAQELIYFRTEGKRLRPDLVLAFWHVGNDLTDIVPGFRVSRAGTDECYAPYFAICEGRFDAEPIVPSPGLPVSWDGCSRSLRWLSRQAWRLYDVSALYRRAGPYLRWGRWFVPRYRMASPWWTAKHAPLDYAYALTDAVYQELLDQANQVGARLAVVIVPFRPAVEGELAGEPWEYAGFQIAPQDGRRPNLRFSALMNQKRLPVLDLHPRFRALRQSTGALPYWPDSHWNALGNRWAADTVASWLVEQALVPIPRSSRSSREAARDAGAGL